MSPTVERILEEVRTLPLIEQIRLSRLLAQETMTSGIQANADESLALADDETEIEARRQAIRQARGSMAGLLPSTEVFLAARGYSPHIEKHIPNAFKAGKEVNQ